MNHSFFRQDTVTLAQKLLGHLLVHRTPEGVTAGMIVETEAYVGAIDKACHAYKNRSERTEIMYHDGGYAYVYLIYGMHCCFNVVTGPPGEGNAVLIRALEPVEGLALMAERRGTADRRLLCSGPGRLCRAMGIGMEYYGQDLFSGSLRLEEYRAFSPEEIGVSPRVNVDYAAEYRDRLWRFFLKDSPYVSSVPRRYAARCTLAELNRSSASPDEEMKLLRE